MVDFGLPPPRPYRGQQMRTRDWYVQRYLGSGQKILRSEDSSAVYTSPVHPAPKRDRRQRRPRIWSRQSEPVNHPGSYAGYAGIGKQFAGGP
jgi:hypothetical protein